VQIGRDPAWQSPQSDGSGSVIAKKRGLPDNIAVESVWDFAPGGNHSPLLFYRPLNRSAFTTASVAGAAS